LIRTPKENLLRGRTARTGEELRLALIAFRQAYNKRWLIGRHDQRSPVQFLRDQMDTLPLAAELQTGVSGIWGQRGGCGSPAHVTRRRRGMLVLAARSYLH
jgi:hypothetical protein